MLFSNPWQKARQYLFFSLEQRSVTLISQIYQNRLACLLSFRAAPNVPIRYPVLEMTFLSTLTIYDFKVNNETCSGDKPIILVENPSSGGTELPEALRKNEKRGKTVEGVITGLIECENFLNFTGGNVQVRS